jgi:hypothetical protein
MRSVFTARTGRYGELRLTRKKDGERWFWGVCTWNADDGETASDDTVAEYGLCRRLGSGRDTAELYSAIGFEV